MLLLGLIFKEHSQLQGLKHPGPAVQRPGGEAEIKEKLLCARHRLTVINQVPTMHRGFTVIISATL